MNACGRLSTAVAMALLGAGLLLAGGARAQSGSAAADDAFWNSVKSCKYADEVRLYEKQFPNGRHILKALECLAWLDLGPCRGTAQIREYLDFLEQFPAGRHAAEAKACLTRLARAQRSLEIERLLATCAAHVAARRLTTGKGGTAVACYRKVLAKDASNRKALAGLRKIYEAWARAALRRGETTKARHYASKLATLNPRSPALAALRADIDRAKPRWRPGTAFRDCPACPEMVVVPPGSFTMGSPLGEEWRKPGEGPQRRVTIGRAFAVGKYEVSFGEWDACVSTGGCSHMPDDAGWGRDRWPVMNVSWHDAKAYVRWLSRRTGKRYRLLSEAEWEYAARAGTQTAYHWGDAIGRSRASCAEGCSSRRDYKHHAVPVGSFAPNGFGLHDMHGNVEEWVEDCWHRSYSGAPSDGRAWTSGGDCGTRVKRGGSWGDRSRDLRAAARSRVSADNRDWSSGFRVARTLSP